MGKVNLISECQCRYGVGLNQYLAVMQLHFNLKAKIFVMALDYWNAP